MLFTLLSCVFVLAAAVVIAENLTEEGPQTVTVPFVSKSCRTSCSCTISFNFASELAKTLHLLK